MSQQINLLLPELQPKFDWLALPVVAGAALSGLLLLTALGVSASLHAESLKEREQALKTQLTGLQQQVQTLGGALGARHRDKALEERIAELRSAVTQRQEVLDFVGRNDAEGSRGYSGMLQGFSRQTMDGVWLVGFGMADRNVEIRGRLADPSLLPAYIGRLNDEPAFTGRRFATLDMQGVAPLAAKGDDSGAAPVSRGGIRYTEFALRTEAEKAP